MQNKDFFIRCDCGSEGLMFHKFRSENPLYFISLWQECYRTRSIKERIRAIIHIIKTGEPYVDQIILNNDGITKLRDICNSMLDEKSV